MASPASCHRIPKTVRRRRAVHCAPTDVGTRAAGLGRSHTTGISGAGRIRRESVSACGRNGDLICRCSLYARIQPLVVALVVKQSVNASESDVKELRVRALRLSQLGAVPENVAAHATARPLLTVVLQHLLRGLFVRSAVSEVARVPCGLAHTVSIQRKWGICLSISHLKLGSYVPLALAGFANSPVYLSGAVASDTEVVPLLGIIVTHIYAVLADANTVDEADDPRPAMLRAVFREFLRRPFVHRSKISSIISRS